MELGFEDQEFEKEAKTRAYGGKATASKRSFEDFDQKDKSLNTLDKSGRVYHSNAAFEKVVGKNRKE